MCQFLSVCLSKDAKTIYVGDLLSHSTTAAIHRLKPDSYVEAEWTGDSEDKLSIRTLEEDSPHDQSWYKTTILTHGKTRTEFLAWCLKNQPEKIWKKMGVESIIKYARDILKGRWIEAEHFILKNAECTYYYARDVLKGRWIEAEPFISKDAEVAYYYAKDVIKGRWIEAEPIIEGSDYENDYKQAFNNSISSGISRYSGGNGAES